MVHILLAEVFPSDPEVEWIKIPVYDYEINGEGVIINMRDKGKILKQDFKNNAFYIHLYKNGVTKHYQILIMRRNKRALFNVLQNRLFKIKLCQILANRSIKYKN
jgi:hypothetical protein